MRRFLACLNSRVKNYSFIGLYNIGFINIKFISNTVFHNYANFVATFYEICPYVCSICFLSWLPESAIPEKNEIFEVFNPHFRNSHNLFTRTGV